MEDVLLAFALGASVLAIVLLHRTQTRQSARLAKVESDLVAEKIARLAQQPTSVALPMAEELPEEPARRKRHLALYMGGGALAAFTFTRDRLRWLWQGHRVLVVTAAATVATVGTASALVMTASSDGSAEDHSLRPAASAPDRTEVGTSDVPDRGPRGPRGHTPRDKERGSNPSANGAVDLATDGQQRPLDSEESPEPSASGTPPPSKRSGTKEGTGRPSTSATPRPGESTPGSPGPGGPSTETPEGPGSPEPTKPPEPVKPVTPAALTVGTPQLADTDKRWCENVTVDIHNTGGTTATTGTLRFGTHIIGPLGVDWITIRQTRELPEPVPADGHIEGHWTLCVDAWRVPLGFRIDTLDVEVTQN